MRTRGRVQYLPRKIHTSSHSILSSWIRYGSARLTRFVIYRLGVSVRGSYVESPSLQNRGISSAISVEDHLTSAGPIVTFFTLTVHQNDARNLFCLMGAKTKEKFCKKHKCETQTILLTVSLVTHLHLGIWRGCPVNEVNVHQLLRTGGHYRAQLSARVRLDPACWRRALPRPSRNQTQNTKTTV